VGFGGLALFMAGMWAMILAVAAFLLIVVAPLETILPVGRLAVSAVQAAIAIAAMAALVLGLSRMKRIYMHRKLG
jgi:hypothetical protein